MVYAREHDTEDAPWVGHPNGGGWPIFLETADIPTFGALQRQPRTAIQHYKAIEERAGHHIKKWRSLLTATAGLSGEGGREAIARQRYVRAIQWWVDFLADHRSRWPQDGGVDDAGAALAVEEGGNVDDPDMLPLPHSRPPRSLGPLMQRCGNVYTFSSPPPPPLQNCTHSGVEAHTPLHTDMPPILFLFTTKPRCCAHNTVQRPRLQ